MIYTITPLLAAKSVRKISGMSLALFRRERSGIGKWKKNIWHPKRITRHHSRDKESIDSSSSFSKFEIYNRLHLTVLVVKCKLTNNQLFSMTHVFNPSPLARCEIIIAYS